MLIKEWMQPVGALCSPEDSVHKACWKMSENNFGYVLIVDANGRLLGIFTEHDLLTRVVMPHLDPMTTVIRDVMTANPDTAQENGNIFKSFLWMLRTGYLHMPVLRNGKPVGVISTYSPHMAQLLVVAQHHLCANYRKNDVNRVIAEDFEDELLMYALEQFGTKIFKEHKITDTVSELTDSLREEFKRIYDKRFKEVGTQPRSTGAA